MQEGSTSQQEQELSEWQVFQPVKSQVMKPCVFTMILRVTFFVFESVRLRDYVTVIEFSGLWGSAWPNGSNCGGKDTYFTLPAVPSS